jgi:hypothetical protein
MDSRSETVSMTHLKMIKEAKAQSLKNILIFDDDAISINIE